MSVTPPYLLRKEQPIQKAARLIAERRVLRRADTDVYDVAGDHYTYRVLASPDGIFCPCAAHTSLCAHVLAVAQVRLADDPPAGLIADVLGPVAA
jgi:hypothetical protein